MRPGKHKLRKENSNHRTKTLSKMTICELKSQNPEMKTMK